MNSVTTAEPASVNGRAMTIGQLSARTGVPVKALRRHEGPGPDLHAGPQQQRLPAVRRDSGGARAATG